MRFSVSRTNEDGIDLIELTDTTQQTRVAIAPAHGAMLHVFSLHNGNGAYNVIDNYSGILQLQTELDTSFKNCKLSPFACRIDNARYQFDEKEYRIEKFLLNGSALHGLLYDAVFTVTKTWADESAAGVSLQYQYGGSDKGYPFKYTCTVTYELKKDNALTLTTTIINNDEGLIPMQDGWHPYFGFGGNINDLKLEFQSKEIVEFNKALIPTGKLQSYQEYGALKNQ